MVGRTFKEALERPGARDLQWDIHSAGEPRVEQDAHRIRFQAPPAGTRVKPGALVRIDLYDEYVPLAARAAGAEGATPPPNSEDVVVPNVVGKTFKEALERPGARDLQWDIHSAGNPPAEEDAHRIRFQDPPPGTWVKAGALVRIDLYDEYIPPAAPAAGTGEAASPAPPGADTLLGEWEGIYTLEDSLEASTVGQQTPYSMRLEPGADGSVVDQDGYVFQVMVVEDRVTAESRRGAAIRVTQRMTLSADRATLTGFYERVHDGEVYQRGTFVLHRKGQGDDALVGLWEGTITLRESYDEAGRPVPDDIGSQSPYTLRVERRDGKLTVSNNSSGAGSTDQAVVKDGQILFEETGAVTKRLELKQVGDDMRGSLTWTRGGKLMSRFEIVLRRKR